MSILLQESPLEPTVPVKRTGRKGGVVYNALNPRQLHKLGPGRHSDGNNLILHVDRQNPLSDAPPRRRWIVRISIGGKQRDIGLGGWPLVSLESARDQAIDIRRAVKAGLNPLAQRHVAKAAEAKPALSTLPMLREVADAYYRMQKFTNAKYELQWWRDVETHVLNFKIPSGMLGDLPIDQVRSGDLLPAFEQIWQRIPDTASKTLNRIEGICAYGKAKYNLLGNPSDGLDQVLGDQGHKTEHHPALQRKDARAFVQSLRTATRTNLKIARMTEFCLETVKRTTEVRGARWSEMMVDDQGRRFWRIPGGIDGRLKVRDMTHHDEPLSARACDILDEMQQFRTSADADALVFPADHGINKMYSNVAMLNCTKTLDTAFVDKHGNEITVHGFRACFRTWASEVHRDFGSFDAVEMALTHVSHNSKVVRSYSRGDYYEERVAIMTAWSRFLAGEGK